MGSRFRAYDALSERSLPLPRCQISQQPDFLDDNAPPHMCVRASIDHHCPLLGPHAALCGSRSYKAEHNEKRSHLCIKTKYNLMQVFNLGK